MSARRADFREGSVDAIPFDAASFGKACTVNSIYFWRSLDGGFAEIHRVLAPGSRVVVGFLPEEWMDRQGYPADIFTSRAPEHVVAALSRVGFREHESNARRRRRDGTSSPHTEGERSRAALPRPQQGMACPREES